jgi:hypothetical protein
MLLVEVAGIEIRGGMYHALAIQDGRITKVEDHADHEYALSVRQGGRSGEAFRRGGSRHVRRNWRRHPRVEAGLRVGIAL